MARAGKGIVAVVNVVIEVGVVSVVKGFSEIDTEAPTSGNRDINRLFNTCIDIDLR